MVVGCWRLAVSDGIGSCSSLGRKCVRGAVRNRTYLL